MKLEEFKQAVKSISKVECALHSVKTWESTEELLFSISLSSHDVKDCEIWRMAFNELKKAESEAKKAIRHFMREYYDTKWNFKCKAKGFTFDDDERKAYEATSKRIRECNIEF